MLSEGVEPHARFYYLLIKCWAKLGSHPDAVERARKWLDAALQLKDSSQARIWEPWVAVLLKNGHVEEVHAIEQKIESGEIPYDDKIPKRIYQAYNASLRPEEAD